MPKDTLSHLAIDITTLYGRPLDFPYYFSLPANLYP